MRNAGLVQFDFKIAIPDFRLHFTALITSQTRPSAHHLQQSKHTRHHDPESDVPPPCHQTTATNPTFHPLHQPSGPLSPIATIQQPTLIFPLPHLFFHTSQKARLGGGLGTDSEGLSVTPRYHDRGVQGNEAPSVSSWYFMLTWQSCELSYRIRRVLGSYFASGRETKLSSDGSFGSGSERCPSRHENASQRGVGRLRAGQELAHCDWLVRNFSSLRSTSLCWLLDGGRGILRLLWLGGVGFGWAAASFMAGAGLSSSG